MRFHYVYRKPDSAHPSIIEDLLELTAQQDGLDMCIEMIEDLYHFAHQSRFVRAMHGPLAELKSQTRGGERGGSRVYFAWVGKDAVLLLTAEIKEGSAPSHHKLAESVRLMGRWKSKLEQPSKLEQGKNPEGESNG